MSGKPLDLAPNGCWKFITSVGHINILAPLAVSNSGKNPSIKCRRYEWRR
jgi:hypothetical protein